MHEKSPTDKCRHIDSSSTSEAYQDGSSWGLTVFQIMSGLCVWRKEAVKLHSSVCAWGVFVYTKLAELLSLCSMCLRPAGVLSTSRVTLQVSTGWLAAHHSSRKVITPYDVSLCLCVCVCVYCDVFSTSALWHIKKVEGCLSECGKGFRIDLRIDVGSTFRKEK